MSDDLLAAPRGRRLCLELAKEASEDVSLGLFDLSYNAAIAAGASISRFGWNQDGSTFQTSDPIEPRTSLSRVAEVIRGLGALPPNATQPTEALRRSVNAAMYWQEPDGDDLIAADPEIRTALQAIAAAVSALPSTQWWHRDRADEQWAVRFEPLDGDASFDPKRGGASRWSASAAEEERRAAVDRPSDPTVNVTGTWWSPPVFEVPSSTGAIPPDDGASLPVGLVCVEDGTGSTQALATPVRGGGRTCEIRNAADWAELCARFPLEVTASRRHDWYRFTGRDGRWLLPDWGRVAQEWDAVHLTVFGYLTAATREIAIDDEYSSVIAGWNPDETYWLTGFVRESGSPRVRWVSDDHGDSWHRDA